MDPLNRNTHGESFPKQGNALLPGNLVTSLRSKNFLFAVFSFRAKLLPSQKAWQVSVREKCFEGNKS